MSLGVLPGFIECIRPITVAKCGETPINVLNAMAAGSASCPVDVKAYDRFAREHGLR